MKGLIYLFIFLVLISFIYADSGNVVCWGGEGIVDFGQSVGYNRGDAAQISAGRYHTCTLKSNNNVECWGRNNYGQSSNYTKEDAIYVAAGYWHTCVVKSNGNAECWGAYDEGGAENYTGGDAAKITAGGGHTCVLKSNGNAECWGSNSSGQSNPYNRGDAIQITAGGYHTCILSSSGNVGCWGNNAYGQSNPYNGGDAIQVSAGDSHTCILKSNGNVKCWGAWYWLGDFDYTNGDAVQVSAGDDHTCILKSDGNVECWGRNDYGEAQNYSLGDATQLSVGGFHNCVLRADPCANGMMDFDEEGVDCGGSCEKECDYCIPIIKNGDPHYKIDFVFIGDSTYRNSSELLFHDSIGKVQKIQGVISNSSEINRFNFYYVKEEAKSSDDCGKLPKDFETKCPYVDSVSVLHTNNMSDCTRGSVFTAEGMLYTNNSFVHELGHGVFGLADEYEDTEFPYTKYFQPDPYANIWKREEYCWQDAMENGWNPDECNKFCDYFPACYLSSLGGWWSLGDFTIMSYGYLYDDFKQDYGRAGKKRADWVLDEIRGGAGFKGGATKPSFEKAILLELNLNNEVMSMLGSRVLYGISRNYLTQNLQFNVTIYALNGSALGSFSMWDPRIALVENGSNTSAWTDDINFTVVLPYIKDSEMIEIKNESSVVLIEVNITDDLNGLCLMSDSKCDFDCPFGTDPDCNVMPISNCTTINESGSYYLTEDIIDAMETCINISANNVSFDCRGYAIDGGSNADYGIYIARISRSNTDIIIKNCIITDWGFWAIYLYNADNNTFKNLNISSNKGMESDEGGILLASSSNNIITNSHVNNNLGNGIGMILSSYNNTISFNHIFNNTFGVYLIGVPQLGMLPTDNLIDNNRIYDNLYQGIILTNSPSSLIYNNTIFNNGQMGIWLYPSTDDIIADNNIFNNQMDGINVYGTANMIFNNIIYGNSDSGIDVYSGLNNSIYNNLFNNSQNVFLNIGKVNYWSTQYRQGTNIVGGNYLGGNYWTNPDGDGFSDKCIDIDHDGICDSSYDLSGDGSNIDYLPLAKPPTLMKEFNVILQSGWNLISIPLKLMDNPISLFNEKNLTIFGYKNNSWFVPEHIEAKLGYWVKANGGFNLTLAGNEIEDRNINLSKGWNLIGYPSLNGSLVNETFNNSQISDVMMYNNLKWYSYNPSRPDFLNTLNNMTPGYGYWVNAKENFTLIFSAKS